MPDASVLPFVETVRSAARKLILYLPHALERMSSPDRMITTEEIRTVVFDGEIIEDYPEDVRGHSCLMLGYSPGDGRPIHVVCSLKDEYLAIITVYVPDARQWAPGFRKRLKETSE